MIKHLYILVLWTLLATIQLNLAAKVERQSNGRKFPDSVEFGVATASYQVEGAWNAADKGENIWDHLTHNEPWRVDNEDNGDIAGDSYNKWARDAEMCAELGVDFYRISISWSRILPTGFANHVSEDGVAYYNNLINELLKYNVKPVLTLYHWDLPQPLQLLGGWSNPLIETWFRDFARVAYEKFGDRVQEWVTMNEPFVVCYQGYGGVDKAPALNYKGIADYLCMYNLMRAHAAAYRLYDQEFRPTQQGRVGLTIHWVWHEPASDSEDDILAAAVFDEFLCGVNAHPIFTPEGNWPPLVIEQIAAKSAEQGYPRSRLPEFTPEEIENLKGSADFFGLNHYTTRYAYRNSSLVFQDVPSSEDDMNVGAYYASEWEIAKSPWLRTVPWGFRKTLNAIKERYGNPEIRIYENGFSTDTGLQDDARISYYRQYLSELLSAILDDGVNVKAYTAWSLMDNFEWLEGYSSRFGLYEIDYEDPERTRTPRKSAHVYKEIIKSRVIDFDYEPKSFHNCH